MKIKSSELKSATFKKQLLGGFDKLEVSEYLEHVADNMDTLQEEKEQLKAELAEAKKRITQLERMEGKIMHTFSEAETAKQRTLSRAEQEAVSIIRNAKREAEIIMSEAKQNAQQSQLEVERHAHELKRIGYMMIKESTSIYNRNNITVKDTPAEVDDSSSTKEEKKDNFFDEVLNR